MAAAKKPHLRAVAADEKPAQAEQRKLMTVELAASEGDRLDLLIAMRARVATAVQDSGTPARDLAALTRRLMEIAKDIEVLQAAEKDADADEGDAEDEAFDASAI